MFYRDHLIAPYQDQNWGCYGWVLGDSIAVLIL